MDLSSFLLGKLGFATLIRQDYKKYEFFGESPEFYNNFFPPSSDGKPSNCPWENSSMLEFFLDDAESFFETAKDGEQLVSGVWEEECSVCKKSYFFVSMAVVYLDKKILIIRDITNDFIQYRNMVVEVRKNMLKQGELQKSLVFYQNKSSYDALTTVYNKETFLELLQKSFATSVIDGSNSAVFMLDVDDFKMVNDEYGHIEGDNVLRNIGILIKDSLRKDDIVGRYGGEEFIVLVPNTTPEFAFNIGEKIRLKIEDYDFKLPRKITISIGCTIYRHGETLSECLQRADDALYESKRNNKNRVCFI